MTAEAESNIEDLYIINMNLIIWGKHGQDFLVVYCYRYIQGTFFLLKMKTDGNNSSVQIVYLKLYVYLIEFVVRVLLRYSIFEESYSIKRNYSKI